MSTQSDPEIILYDLASTKNHCFSQAVWRIRLMLNYKKIPYRTVFLEFADIEPELKKLDISPSSATGERGLPFTVPTIVHPSTGKTIMDLPLIAQFLEATYPSPALLLATPLGDEIQRSARAALAGTFKASVQPREISLLPSPRSQDLFRRTHEPRLGCTLESLLEPAGREDEVWEKARGDLEAASRLLKTNEKEGPFIEGAEVSLTDFVVVGALQCAREVHERTWERFMEFDGFRRLYEAVEKSGWLERKD